MYKDITRRLEDLDNASTPQQVERIGSCLQFLKNVGSDTRLSKFRDIEPMLLTKIEASDLIAELIIEQREAKKEQLNKLNK